MVDFTKMHVCGNDFVVVDNRDRAFTPDENSVRAWGDRRKGIGFDQLLTLELPRDDGDDFFMAIRNSDGSEAEQCGNGCAAVISWALQRQLTNASQVRLGTPSGTVICEPAGDSNDYLREVSVWLTPPDLRPEAVPFVTSAQGKTHSVEFPGNNLAEMEITVLSMGNPHAVLLVDDVDSFDLASVGTALQIHNKFPESVNVEVLQCIDRTHGELRIFERGAGETLACGTGACAATVVGRLLGHFDEKVELKMPGGTVEVLWSGEGSPVKLNCHVELSYIGQIDL